jgi:hypothetical protein
VAGYERREHPEFSWSHSRDRLLAECHRAYFLRYYASHNGWERDAPAFARRAWALGKLSSIPSALGTALHDRALECVATVQAGAELPSAAELIGRTRAALNTLRERRDRNEFLARPKQLPMLRELYYGATIRRDVVERTRRKIVTCIGNLLASPLWADLRHALDSGGEVRVVDGYESFPLGDLTVYGAPDLVYRSGRDERPVLVDWKSGQLDGSIDQIAVCGILVRDHLGWPMLNGSYLARVIGLSEGQEHQFAVDERDLADAEARISTSVKRMRALLVDPDRNIPHQADAAFPLKWGGVRCRFCPYLELCRAHVARDPDEDKNEDAA